MSNGNGMSEEEKIICCVRRLCCSTAQEYRQAWRDYVKLRLPVLTTQQVNILGDALYRDFGKDVGEGAKRHRKD